MSYINDERDSSRRCKSEKPLSMLELGFISHTLLYFPAPLWRMLGLVWA